MSRAADREFRLEVFKLLQKNQSIPIVVVQRTIDLTAGIKGRSFEEVIRVLDDLTTQGLARLSGNVYHILPKGSDEPPHAYLYSLIRESHNEVKEQIKKYDLVYWVSGGLAAILFAAALLILLSVPFSFQMQMGLSGTASVLLLAFALREWWMGKHRIFKEKRLGTKLLDAYLLLRDKDDRVTAAKMVKEVSVKLQEPLPTYVWGTLNSDRKNLARIGVDLGAILVPAIPDKTHSQSELGEVIVRIASLLFEASPESVRRAISDSPSSVYGGLPVPEEKLKKVTPSVRDQLSNWRRIRAIRFLAVLAIVAIGAFVAASLYSSFFGVPLQFSTADFVMICLGIPAAAAILDRYVVAPRLGS